jgi:hypothetical protein
MANAFKTKTFGGGSTAASTAMTIYTCPSSTETTIIGMTVSNISTSQILVDVTFENSDGNNVHILKQTPIPVGGGLVPIGGDQKIVMEAADVIKVTSDTANSADTILSILEIT